MKVHFWLLGSALLMLEGCTDINGGTGSTETGFIKELPEGVIAIAAPYQDLNAVRLDGAKRCFVYRHVGPVETTFLPLRSAAGSPICTRLLDSPEAS